VIDAVRVPGGFAALVRGPGGERGIVLLDGSREPAVLLPGEPARVVAETLEPLVVRVHLEGGLALSATHLGH
jgi:hypothetical protein